MPTYLGWTVQTVPSSPVAPASLEVQHIPIVATTTNPFTGQQIVYAWQNGAAAATYRELSISMPPMNLTNGQLWAAFLISLDGPNCVFQIPSSWATKFPVELATSGSPAYFRLKQGSPPRWSIRRGVIYSLTLEVREAI